jgi:hypothetical protein
VYNVENDADVRSPSKVEVCTSFLREVAQLLYTGERSDICFYWNIRRLSTDIPTYSN